MATYSITTLVENCVYNRKLEAEHGLSLYVRTPEKRILFDTGQSDLLLRNATLLHIDLRRWMRWFFHTGIVIIPADFGLFWQRMTGQLSFVSGMP